MKTLNRIGFGLACISLLLTAGCVKLWQKNLDIRTYVIEATRDSEVVEKPLADKLWIESVVVLPPSNVRNLILRKSDVEYSTSYYTELLMSPSENFRNEFFAWFASSGAFSEVSLVSRAGMSHRMAVTVMQFYGDAIDQKAVLKIKATLFDEKTKGMRLLFTKDYGQHIDVVDASAEELIRAYNKALTQILIHIEKDVVSSIQ